MSEECTPGPLEAAKRDEIVAERPDISTYYRLGNLSGSSHGDLFCGLEFIKPNFKVQRISVEMFEGAVVALRIRYLNGVIYQQGRTQTPADCKPLEYSLRAKEKIISCWIEIGSKTSEDHKRVTGLKLFTNQGNKLDTTNTGDGKLTRGGFNYTDISSEYRYPTIEYGCFQGIWGQGVGNGNAKLDGIYRLGMIWGTATPVSNIAPVPPIPTLGATAVSGSDGGAK